MLSYSLGERNILNPAHDVLHIDSAELKYYNVIKIRNL